MRSTFLAVLLIIIISLDSNVTAQDAKQDFVNQPFQSISSVSEGADLIRTTLQNQGFEIITTIDHLAAARSVDLDLPPAGYLV